MVINHNLMAGNAKRQSNISNARKKKSIERLSSGFSINRAADNAAGLSISEKMRGQIRGLERASQNVQDGISLIQVAEGALNEDHAILQRMNELAVQAANDTNTYEDRSAIQKELNQMIMELDRIANTTAFNADIHPLRKTVGNVNLLVTDSPKVSADTLNSMTKQTIDLRALSDGNYNGYSVNGNTITITGSDRYEITGNMTGTDKKIVVDGNAVLSFSGNMKGAPDITVNSGKNAVLLSPPYADEGLGHAIMLGDLNMAGNSTLTVKYDPSAYSTPNTGVEFGNVKMASNTTLNIEGATVQFTSSETSGKAEGASNTSINLYYDVDNNSRSNLFGSSLDVDKVVISSGMLNLSGENAGISPDTTVSIKDGSRVIATSVAGAEGYMMFADYNVEITDEEPDDIWIQAGANSGQGILIDKVDATASALGFDYLSVMSHKNAGKAITTIHNAIERVSSYRSYLGAMHNRLEHAFAVDQNTAENLQYAESRIRDADMAKEMIEYSKSDVLNNAAQAMIAQANQQPQGVLKILQ